MVSKFNERHSCKTTCISTAEGRKFAEHFMFYVCILRCIHAFLYMAFADCKYMLVMPSNLIYKKIPHVSFIFHTGLQTFICAARVTFRFYRVHHIVYKTAPVAHHSNDAILSIPVFFTAFFNSISSLPE